MWVPNERQPQSNHPRGNNYQVEHFSKYSYNINIKTRERKHDTTIHAIVSTVDPTTVSLNTILTLQVFTNIHISHQSIKTYLCALKVSHL